MNKDAIIRNLCLKNESLKAEIRRLEELVCTQGYSYQMSTLTKAYDDSMTLENDDYAMEKT